MWAEKGRECQLETLNVGSEVENVSVSGINCGLRLGESVT